MDEQKIKESLPKLTVSREENERIYTYVLQRKARYIKRKKRNESIAYTLLICVFAMGMFNMQAIAAALNGLFSFIWGIGVIDGAAAPNYVVLQEPFELNDPEEGHFTVTEGYADGKNAYFIVDIRDAQWVKEGHQKNWHDFLSTFDKFNLVINGERRSPVAYDFDDTDFMVVHDEYRLLEGAFAVTGEKLLEALSESADSDAAEYKYDMSNLYNLYLVFNCPESFSDFEFTLGETSVSATLSLPLKYSPVASQIFGDIEISIVALGENRFAYTGHKVGTQEVVPLYYHSALLSGVQLIDEQGNKHATQQKLPQQFISPPDDISFITPSLIEPLEKTDSPIVGISFSALSAAYTLTPPEKVAFKPAFQGSMGGTPLLTSEVFEEPAISIPITLPKRGETLYVEKDILIGNSTLTVRTIKQYEEHFEGDDGSVFDYYGYKIDYKIDSDLLVRPLVGYKELSRNTDLILGGHIEPFSIYPTYTWYTTDLMAINDMDIFDQEFESTLDINVAARVFGDGEIMFVP